VDTITKKIHSSPKPKSQPIKSSIEESTLLCKSECPPQKLIFTEGPPGPAGPPGVSCFDKELLYYNKINVYSKEIELCDSDSTVFLEGKTSFTATLPKLTNNDEDGTTRNYRVIKIKGINRSSYLIHPNEGDKINNVKSFRLASGKTLTLYGCNNNWITIYN
jgi:hypothetical protein